MGVAPGRERTLVLGAVVRAQCIGRGGLAGAQPARIIFALAPAC